MTTIITVALPKLHEAQRAINASPARFKVLCCGRRFGKTELAKEELINPALDGKPTAYFTLTYSNVREMWDRVMKTARPVIQTANVQARRITLITGGHIDFWSLQSPDAIRGFAYARAVLDEAAQIPNLEYVWNEAVRPTLTDYEGGALFPSTPRGRNYFFQLYMRGLDPMHEDWASFHYPTAANPYLPPGEIELARQELPERAFQQEYLAEFLEDGGAVFRGVNACIKSIPTETEAGHDYIFGVDWAKDNDFTVIAVIDRTTSQLVALDRFNSIGWSLQRGRLAALYDVWKPSIIWAEENSIGGPNIEALQNEGLPVQPFLTTGQTKAPLIESLALAFERQEIGIINDPVLIGELQAYTMDRLPSGRFAYSAPTGMHDDTVIALALAWHGCLNSGFGMAFF